jgi:arginine-tRNA-protein transferase
LGLLVDDREQPCPYFPDRIARLPLRMPIETLAPEEFDRQLAAGARRWGRFLYRPQCPTCVACEPLRIDVGRFRPDRSQRRTWRRGAAELTTEVGSPLVDGERLALFETHKARRGLGARGDAITAEGYRAFLVDRCTESIELTHYHAGRLAGVAVADRGWDALSAVYCFYDPGLPWLGIGTYSILSQLDYCRRAGLRWLYLGYFIAGHPHMAYKARFLPHERLIEGAWMEFERAPGRPAM